MPCLHRFHKELLPKDGMKFLFIGTFNPIWNIKKGDNPDYFYSREKNEFWCILPHALNQNCLVDKDRAEKEKFCQINKIGLTDLIYCISNVEEQSKKHDFLIKGFKDEDFEKEENDLEIEFFTDNIKEYITKNRKTLKGVFFTRKTKKNIERIWAEWIKVKKHCGELSVYSSEIASPSPRGGGIRSKIFSWRKEIQTLLKS